MQKKLLAKDGKDYEQAAPRAWPRHSVNRRRHCDVFGLLRPIRCDRAPCAAACTRWSCLGSAAAQRT
jgi:hypothetical protein